MNNLFSGTLFRFDHLSGLMLAGIGLFFILTLVYSRKFMQAHPAILRYYTYIILTAASSILVVLTDNLIVLTAAWGFLGLMLYLLINMGDKGSPEAAKKALIIVGGTDALMIWGLAIVYYFSQTMQMSNIGLRLDSGLKVAAYICIAIACFAKAGAMPFHSWIPDCAEHAPIPVTAYLPASLDKLLGIYLLARISLDLFVLNMAMNNFLMFIGAFTIIGAVMMALVQHNMKKLLGYHAVSQVGYMVLGIGTANPIGIAGAIFHMLNHAVYKSCLFFSVGNVEYRAKTSELDALGGLAKFMPITYLSFLIASLSISGIPPFNGFISKWLIYQGLVSRISESGSSAQVLFVIFCLIAAMFGSALTLASFMKLLHAVFLGQRLSSNKTKDIREVPFSMCGVSFLLAIICILFGVFAFSLPLKYFIFPIVSKYSSFDVPVLLGLWSPGLATLLIVIGMLIGFIIFKLMGLKSALRQDKAFVGCETPDINEESAVTGVDFYKTIEGVRLLRRIYKSAEKGTFDIYEQSKKIFSFSKFLRYLHNGVLPTYLVWVLLGMIGLFLVLAGSR